MNNDNYKEKIEVLKLENRLLRNKLKLITINKNNYNCKYDYLDKKIKLKIEIKNIKSLLKQRLKKKP